MPAKNHKKETRITPKMQLKTGQALMLNLNAPKTGKAIGPHPWLILHVDNETIEIVQCSTNRDKDRDKNRESQEFKRFMNNRFNDNGPDCFYINPNSQYPPFSQDKTHTTAVMLEERLILPLIELYKMKDAYFYDNNGRNETFDGQLDKDVLNRIRKASYETTEWSYDPFNYIEQDNVDWSVETFIKHQSRENPAQTRNIKTFCFASEPGKSAALDF